MKDINVGDKVICIEGFVDDDNLTNGGGYGYQNGLIFIVTNRGGLFPPKGDYWVRDDYGSGVWTKALNKVTPITPLRNIKKHKIG